MIHAANTVTYNMANDDESFNKETASDSLEWHRSYMRLRGTAVHSMRTLLPFL